jgi:hypothetical protein
VHVRVDETGHDVAARRVQRLGALVVADAGDVAVADRHVAVEPLAGEDGEDASAADDEVGGLVAARHGDASRQAHRPTISSGRMGTRGVAAGGGAHGRGDGGRCDDGGRLANALDAIRRVGLGFIDEHRLDRRHVERRRQQVVGEARVPDHAVLYLELLHQREADALRGAALDLAVDGERVQRAADVLRRADPDEPRQPELKVDFRHDLHRRQGEGDVGSLAEHLAGHRIERRRGRMAIGALDAHLATVASPLRQRVVAGEPNCAGSHPRHARRRRRAGGADAGRAGDEHRDVVGLELHACHLSDDVCRP